MFIVMENVVEVLKNSNLKLDYLLKNYEGDEGGAETKYLPYQWQLYIFRKLFPDGVILVSDPEFVPSTPGACKCTASIKKVGTQAYFDANASRMAYPSETIDPYTDCQRKAISACLSLIGIRAYEYNEASEEKDDAPQYSEEVKAAMAIIANADSQKTLGDLYNGTPEDQALLLKLSSSPFVANKYPEVYAGAYLLVNGTPFVPTETKLEIKEAPKTETKPVVEEAPKAEAKPVVKEAPKAEAKPVVKEAPKTETKPVVEEAPKTEAKPVVKEAPKTEAKPVVKEAPKTETKPVVEETPKTEAKPVVKEAPKTETKPVVEEAPKTETKPVVKEAPKTEAKPVVEETPKAEAKPVVEETPKAEAKPVVKEAPKAEAKPVVEETPKAETKPVVEEAPVNNESDNNTMTIEEARNVKCSYRSFAGMTMGEIYDSSSSEIRCQTILEWFSNSERAAKKYPKEVAAAIKLLRK